MKANLCFFGLLILFFLSACKMEEPVDPCDQLIGDTPPEANQFIIRVHDSLKIDEDRFRELIPQEAGRFFRDAPAIQVTDVCMCRLILISTDYPPDIDMEETAKDARSRLQAQGSEVIADIATNVRFPVRPYERPDSLRLEPGQTPDLRVEEKPGADSVVVAIIDTGVDYLKPELRNRLWINREDPLGGGDEDDNCLVDDTYGYDFINDDRRIWDVDGHGTHINGIIARGLDPNLSIYLMNLKISHQGEANLFDAACAIHYAIEKGADILNLSWGYYGEPSPLLENALIRAQGQGILVVASTGNDNSDNDSCPHWPSNTGLDNIIAVAALDTLSGPRQVAGFSNYGKTMVDLSAPGTLIESYYPAMPPDPNRTAVLNGTSMAAAFITRQAAVIWANNPGFGYSQVRSQILLNLNPLDVVNKATVTEKWTE